MFKKTMITTVAALCVVPFMAQAHDLTIVNKTSRDSTSVINNGACSTILGEHGVTRAHSTNVVPSVIVNFACMFNSSNCTANVYMTDNCSGPVVATAVFDTKNGLKSLNVLDKSYNVSYSGFDITIEGGPK